MMKASGIKIYLFFSGTLNNYFRYLKNFLLSKNTYVFRISKIVILNIKNNNNNFGYQLNIYFRYPKFLFWISESYFFWYPEFCFRCPKLMCQPHFLQYVCTAACNCNFGRYFQFLTTYLVMFVDLLFPVLSGNSAGISMNVHHWSGPKGGDDALRVY